METFHWRSVRLLVTPDLARSRFLVMPDLGKYLRLGREKDLRLGRFLQLGKSMCVLFMHHNSEVFGIRTFKMVQRYPGKAKLFAITAKYMREIVKCPLWSQYCPQTVLLFVDAGPGDIGRC